MIPDDRGMRLFCSFGSVLNYLSSRKTQIEIKVGGKLTATCMIDIPKKIKENKSIQ